MAEQTAWTDQVAAYVTGELTSAEAQAFEAAMQADPALAEEVQLQREAVAALNLYTQLTYKSQLQAFDAELEAEATPVVPLKTFWQQGWTRMAAVFLLLIASVYLVMSLRGGPESWARDAYEPYQDALSMRSADDPVKNIMERYQAEDYAAFVPQMESYLAEQSAEQPLAELYLGLGYLRNGQEPQAIELLSRLTEVSITREQAEWYLSLAYLQAGEVEAGKTLLNQIQAQIGHNHQADAKELLEKW
jgi:hypothetical protein